jgi:hypothetical protein
LNKNPEEIPMKRLLMSCALYATPWLAYAHEGHGLPGAHWHATDAWGYVALAVIAAVSVWFSRRK